MHSVYWLVLKWYTAMYWQDGMEVLILTCMYCVWWIGQISTNMLNLSLFSQRRVILQIITWSRTNSGLIKTERMIKIVRKLQNNLFATDIRIHSWCLNNYIWYMLHEIIKLQSFFDFINNDIHDQATKTNFFTINKIYTHKTHKNSSQNRNTFFLHGYTRQCPR